MVEVDGRNLIFILSAPRSGSTLLAAMLGSHGAILAPPEPWLLLPLSLFGANDAQVIAAYDHELARLAVQGVADAALLGSASAAFARTIYNHRLQRAGKSVFVDKTPRYFHILPWIGTLFPASLKIWLQRNPLDVIASCKLAWKMSIDEVLGDSISPNSFDATLALDRLASFFSTGPAGAITVRYEELAAEPVPHLERICHAAGLQFETHMLDYGQNDSLLKSYATSAFGDRGLLKHRRAHTLSIDCWRAQLTPEEVRRALTTLGSDIFMHSGYAATFHEAAAVAGLAAEDIDRRGRLDHLGQQCADYALRSLPSSPGAARTVVTQLYADLQGHLAAREQEYTDLQRQLLARQQECTQLGAEVANLRQQLGAEVADLRQQLASVTERAHTEVADLRQQLASVTERARAAVAAHATVAAHLAVLERQAADQQTLSDAQQRELTEQARRLSDYESAWRAMLQAPAYRLLRFLRLWEPPNPLSSSPTDAGPHSVQRTAQRQPPST